MAVRRIDLLQGTLDLLILKSLGRDPSTYAVVLLLIGLVAGVAAYVPARRAARIEPLLALRQE